MNNAPNHGRLVAILAALALLLAACQSPDAAPKPALTTAQAQALSDLGQMLRRPADGVATTNVHGGVRADLQGGFHHAMMVQVNPDGTSTFVCTDSIDTAAEFLTRGAPVKADEK